MKKLTTTDTNITVTDLKPETCYILEVSLEFVDGNMNCELALTHTYTGEGNKFQNKVSSFMSKSNSFLLFTKVTL